MRATSPSAAEGTGIGFQPVLPLGTSITGSGVDFTPALTRAYPRGTQVVDQGTGLDLAAPLRFQRLY